MSVERSVSSGLMVVLVMPEDETVVVVEGKRGTETGSKLLIRTDLV